MTEIKRYVAKPRLIRPTPSIGKKEREKIMSLCASHSEDVAATRQDKAESKYLGWHEDVLQGLEEI